MSHSSATAARRSTRSGAGGVRKRREDVRRRRGAVFLGLVVLAVVVAVVAVPVARKAISEFGLPLQYQDDIRQQAVAKHLDPALIAAVIDAETKFDPRQSSAGAEGLMQILPQTALFLAHKSGATTFHVADLGTPAVNIAYGSSYLRYLLDEYHGNTVLALAAYNGGEANVDRWVARVRARGGQFAISDIPFPETQAYVQRVLQARLAYRHTYPTELGLR